jgi:hypothetical protein
VSSYKKAEPSGISQKVQPNTLVAWTYGFAQKQVWLTKKCACQTHAAQNQ